jgi:hypothetical protein
MRRNSKAEKSSRMSFCVFFEKNRKKEKRKKEKRKKEKKRGEEVPKQKKKIIWILNKIK